MQDSLIHYLETLVALYPQSDNQTAVKKALQYCQEVISESGSFKDAKIHEHEGVYSLTASTQGTKQPKLLLQGHIDVVPCPGNAVMKVADNGKMLSGRGVFDMLFATACYLAFIEEHAEKLSGLDLGLMLTGDEEIGGFNGTEYLLQQGYGCEVCFLPDAGERFGELSVAAKGVYNFDLVVKGADHHGSRPWEGDGAANKLVSVLSDLMTAFDPSEKANSTVTVTRLTGGDSLNRGPAEVMAHIDIRYKDKTDHERIKKVVSGLCAENDAEVQNMLEAGTYELDTSNPYAQAFIKLYEQHAGQPIKLSKAHGGSDARFFSERQIPVLMLRPDGGGAHSARESLSLNSLMKFYRLFEEFTLKTAKM